MTPLIFGDYASLPQGMKAMNYEGPIAMGKENLFLCMGSACHQLGVYDVLPKLQELIAEYELEGAIELKGSFCLETCSKGIVMKFQDTHFTNINPQNVEAKFKEEILPSIQKTLAHVG